MSEIKSWWKIIIKQAPFPLGSDSYSDRKRCFQMGVSPLKYPGIKEIKNQKLSPAMWPPALHPFGLCWNARRKYNQMTTLMMLTTTVQARL